ncbi:Chromatin modification-related [Lecanosticta acicola]|uniref:Chromatin modification-related n=1 Tax=Lecanosticta acicola TaxID=111012 RepID=A0AAI9EFA3_9PEZI|nr:Chromatin modification-related [Lecanosticta acicola]
MGKLPHYDTLSFLYDNDDGCALTARVHGEWYHVMIDAGRLQDRSKSGKRVARDYRRLLGQVKESEQTSDGVKTTAPLFVQPDEDEDDEADEGKDSAVDVHTPEEDEDHSTEPSKALECWMLSPLSDTFSARKKESKTSRKRSVEAWYLCPTHYFRLCVQDGKLRAEEDSNPSSALRQRIQALIPSMPLHKYISDLDIPMHKAKDLTVLLESSEPADTPLHPCLVRHNQHGPEYFLKTVDRGQLQPMNKRELQVMKRIESEGLHNEIRVPLLRGLVQFSTSNHSQNKQDIMGFLMDPIQDPKPLTHMLDTQVSEEKRLKWAEESARMVDVLHQHGITWGDAKGDNFMVDKDDELWIIDFGGSYTEGWVDERLMETVEGDKQGIERLQNGLEDPENNTTRGAEGEEEEEEETEVDEADVDEADLQETKEARRQARESCAGWEERYEQEQKQYTSGAGSRKRKAADGIVDSREQKSAKQDHDADAEPRYCYCNQPESGKMLGCDGQECPKQWFHFSCVGLKEAPTGKWYCKGCRSA